MKEKKLKTLYTLIFVLQVLIGFGQEEMAFSKSELEFIDGYNNLLAGNHKEAIKEFEYQIFERANYNAVPYYKMVYCAASKEIAPKEKRVKQAIKLAKKHGNDWGTGHLGKKLKRAMPDMKTKADAGNAVAQLNLGLAYEYGRGMKKNPTQAASYIKLASDQDLTCATYVLGMYNAKGFGIKKDLDKAIELIEGVLKSAPNGYDHKYLNKLKKKKGKL